MVGPQVTVGEVAVVERMYYRDHTATRSSRRLAPSKCSPAGVLWRCYSGIHEREQMKDVLGTAGADEHWRDTVRDDDSAG